MCMRSVMVLALALAAFVTTAGSAAARTTTVRRNFAVVEYDDVYIAMQSVATTQPDLANQYAKGAGYLLSSGLVFSEDLTDGYAAYSKVAHTLIDPRYNTITEVKATITAFEVLKLALLDLTTRQIAYFEQRVNQFVKANPGKPVAAQRKAIDDARELIAPIDAAYSHSKAYIAMKKALAKIAKIKTFPYVAKPPKKQCGPGLKAGEFAEGPLALYDFDTMTVVPSYFRANVAEVKYSTDGVSSSLSFFFGYCDGDKLDRVGIDFSVSGTPGTYNVKGGFVQGPGALCCSLTPASNVTITEIDAARGVVAGTFLLQNSGNYAGGAGRFLLTFEPPK